MRKKQAEKRITLPDPKYNDILVNKLINSVLKKGKKHLARRIVYYSFEVIENKYKMNGLDIFRKALNNVKPLLEIRARRVGGATYQVPTEVREDRSIALALRWLIRHASERKDKSFAEKLASEIYAASNNEGGAIKKKEDTHKMAEANKAFAHFKW